MLFELWSHFCVLLFLFFYSTCVPFLLSFHWFLPWHFTVLSGCVVFIWFNPPLSSLIFFFFFFFSFSVISYFSLWVIAPLPCLLIFFCPIFSLFFSPPLVHLPLLPPPCTSIPSFHFSVSTPVGAGCVRRPSSVSLTCRSTPSRTQRPNLTSVLTAPSHSPTPATWPSTSASTVGPSLTPAPTARNLSGSSVTYSSTHGTTDPPNPITHPYHIPCSLNLSC